MIERRLHPLLLDDLKKKMVFLSGPRQCGKTTLVKAIGRANGGVYYNWDDPSDRKCIQKGDLDWNARLWVFDEIHKFKRWRGVLKGLFDKYGERHSILVTGSARLEAYGHGGDSLQGRYFPHHLHPFSYSEVASLPFRSIEALPEFGNASGNPGLLKDLLRLGGFPEPFLGGSDKEASRWRLSYGARLVQEDVRSLEAIHEVERLELLFDRLSTVAGSVVSINSLREDLEVAFETVKKWVAILERLDAVFRISPYGPPRIKAVKKEQKLYFWDWARAESEGARFENLVAVHLLRLVHWMSDVEGEKWELRFFRHREGQEVDFLLLRKGRPWAAIETKLSDTTLSPSLSYFLERVDVPLAFQLVSQEGVLKRLPDIRKTRVWLVSASRFLGQLP